jgi:outer membrane protein assembly factor BamB
MLNHPNLIFTGMGGRVVAINRLNGEVIWQTKLCGSGFVTVIADDTTVFAQTGGKLFALNLLSGDILWENGLSGCGYGLGCLAFAGGEHSWPAPMVQMQEENDAINSNPGGTNA